MAGLDGAAGYQNLSDLSTEYSLSSFDSRQRLVVSYVYSLPFGHNQPFLANVSGFVDKLDSGWLQWALLPSRRAIHWH